MVGKPLLKVGLLITDLLAVVIFTEKPPTGVLLGLGCATVAQLRFYIVAFIRRPFDNWLSSPRPKKVLSLPVVSPAATAAVVAVEPGRMARTPAVSPWPLVEAFAVVEMWRLSHRSLLV